MNKLNMETTTITQGAHHIGLTVPDIKQTSNFFISELNFKQVGKKTRLPCNFCIGWKNYVNTLANN